MKRKEAMPAFRLLVGRACLQARPVWQEVFSEDSPEFTEYYFREKAPFNRGLTLEGDEGIRSMLYLTPERLYVRDVIVPSAYIVGVATRKEYRHRGYMAGLLERAARLVRGEGMPFMFLMPASPAIYEPFGFRYIYDRPLWDADSLVWDRLVKMEEQDAGVMSDFAAGYLAANKEVYVLRDAAYYKVLLKETAAQNGAVYGYYKDGSLKGLCVYTQDGVPDIQEVLAGPEAEAAFVRRKKESRPVIMARIIHLPSMLALMRSEKNLRLMLEVTDSLIPANNGSFLCRVGTNRCEVVRTKEEGTDTGGGGFYRYRTDIAELTGLLFGYTESTSPVWKLIRPLSRVWINEIV